MIWDLLTVTGLFGALFLVVAVALWPLLPARVRYDTGKHTRPVNGRNLGDQPRADQRLGKQPWLTAGQPALPSPPPQHAYDPGDGILPPVALVRPYLPDAYRCCEHCWDGSPCSPRDNHRTPCADGCNDPAPCTDAETLAMYRGDCGVKPQLEAERLAGVMRP